MRSLQWYRVETMTAHRTQLMYDVRTWYCTKYVPVASACMRAEAERHRRGNLAKLCLDRGGAHPGTILRGSTTRMYCST